MQHSAGLIRYQNIPIQVLLLCASRFELSGHDDNAGKAVTRRRSGILRRDAEGDLARSKAASATASTPSSPRPATTSACSCGGSQNSCVPSSGPSPKLSRLKRSLKSAVARVLHGGRLSKASAKQRSPRCGALRLALCRYNAHAAASRCARAAICCRADNCRYPTHL